MHTAALSLAAAVTGMIISGKTTLGFGGMVRLLSLAEAAAGMGISVKTLKKRIKESGLLLPKPGRSVQITEHDFDLLVESTRCRCTSTPPEQGIQEPVKKTDTSSPSEESAAGCESSTPIRQTSAPLVSVRKSWKLQSLANSQIEVPTSLSQPPSLTVLK